MQSEECLLSVFGLMHAKLMFMIIESIEMEVGRSCFELSLFLKHGFHLSRPL
jgi:hypothetical protein